MTQRKVDGAIERKFWSPAEDETLRTIREQGKTYAEIAKMLPGRSPKACHLRATLLGLTTDYAPWAPEDEARLITLLRSNLGYSQMQQHFPGRSIQSLKMKAHWLREGMKRS